MNVSVIIVTYNGFSYTRQCLESLLKTHSNPALEVIVFDNNSTDGSQEKLPLLFPGIKYIRSPHNVGFGAANNIAADQSRGDILFFVNNDTVFKDDIITPMCKELASHHEYGVLGPKLLNEDGTFQLSYGNDPTIRTELKLKQAKSGMFGHSNTPRQSEQLQEMDWVTGAALMVRKDIFQKTGGFDIHYFMYFEDIDLCRTIRTAGMKIGYVPANTLIHLGGKSYAKQDEKIAYEYRRSQLRYYRKHNSILQNILVRLYLIVKYLPKFASAADSALARRVILLVVTGEKN